MLPLPRPQSNFSNVTGFTLLEMLTVVALVGIICAIAAPSLLAMQSTAKLNNSLGILRDALEITQLKASQKQKDALGNTCRIYIPKNQNKLIGNCFVSSSADSNGVSDNTDASLVINGGTAAGSLPRSLNGWAVINLDSGVTVLDNSTLPGTPPTLAGDPPRITYNLQGLTQNSGILVLGAEGTGEKKCLRLNAGIGLIRGGKYVSNDCEVTE